MPLTHLICMDIILTAHIRKDWTYIKLQEKQGKLEKYDFANANTSPKQIALSGVWSVVVVWFFYTFISDCLAGKYATP